RRGLDTDHPRRRFRAEHRAGHLYRLSRPFRDRCPTVLAGNLHLPAADGGGCRDAYASGNVTVGRSHPGFAEAIAGVPAARNSPLLHVLIGYTLDRSVCDADDAIDGSEPAFRPHL